MGIEIDGMESAEGKYKHTIYIYIYIFVDVFVSVFVECLLYCCCML